MEGFKMHWAAITLTIQNKSIYCKSLIPCWIVAILCSLQSFWITYRLCWDIQWKNGFDFLFASGIHSEVLEVIHLDLELLRDHGMMVRCWLYTNWFKMLHVVDKMSWSGISAWLSSCIYCMDRQLKCWMSGMIGYLWWR